MASAEPVATFPILAAFGCIVLPVIWCILAILQRRMGFRNWFWASIILSTTPVLGFFVLFVGKDSIFISPKVAVITFFLTPIVNVIGIGFVLVAMLIIRFRRKQHQ